MIISDYSIYSTHYLEYFNKDTFSVRFSNLIGKSNSSTQFNYFKNWSNYWSNYKHKEINFRSKTRLIFKKK